MADISITAASVTAASDARKIYVTAGGTITAGMPVYKDTADNNKYKACDANAAASAVCAGVALNGSSDGQPLTVCEEGDVTYNAVLTRAEIYCVSENAGGIAPKADVGTGEYMSVIGVAISTTVLRVKPINSGVVV